MPDSTLSAVHTLPHRQSAPRFIDEKSYAKIFIKDMSLKYVTKQKSGLRTINSTVQAPNYSIKGPVISQEAKTYLPVHDLWSGISANPG